MNYRKALVTGGAGFIGSHLVDALVALHVDVVVLDDLSTGKRENLSQVSDRVTFVEGSVADQETVARVMTGIDVVFHQAAVASVPKSLEDPLGTHAVNVTGTLNVFEEARKAGVKRVVYASSCAIFGDDPELPKQETSPAAPKSPYALHKLTGEKYARLYGELFGLSTVGLRYFNVFGPRQDPSSPYSGVISIFSTRIAEEKPITIFGDGKTTRDFIYVADVVRANILAAEAENPSLAYCVGTGIETTLLEVVSVLEDAIGKKALVEHGKERVGDIKRSVSDSTRAKKELMFHAETDFTEGIAKTIEGLAK